MKARTAIHALVRHRLNGPPTPAPPLASLDAVSPLVKLLNVLRFLRVDVGLRDLTIQALSILLLLYPAGEAGLSPGVLATELDLGQASISKHLRQLGAFYSSGVLCGFGLLEVVLDIRARRGQTLARLTPSGRGLVGMIKGGLL
jgi:hypothetical protein